MIYAWIDGKRRQPLVKGEKTVCRDCGGRYQPFYQHKTFTTGGIKRRLRYLGEPEGPWHLGWKENFNEECREVSLKDDLTNELHRADILYGQGTGFETVLELQHSPISEEERISRETFYRKGRRMFWLVHIDASSTSSNGWNFHISLDFKSRLVKQGIHSFGIMQWFGRSTQFIEKWKRSDAYVFFDFKEHIFSSQ